MRLFLYWVEMVLAPVLSACLFLLEPSAVSLVWFILGAFAWTFIEYAVHKFYLHDMRAKIHLAHHRKPDEKIYQIQYPFWLFAAGTFLVSPIFTSGLLAAYGYYLIVHHCDHHARHLLPRKLLDHHDGHHQFARANYGVSVTFWDKLFGTKI